MVEDPVEESESGGESAMLERESSSTGPQSQGASGLAAGEAEHAHEIQRQNREMVVCCCMICNHNTILWYNNN